MQMKNYFCASIVNSRDLFTWGLRFFRCNAMMQQNKFWFSFQCNINMLNAYGLNMENKYAKIKTYAGN
jgi:hypothetical protein